MFTAETDRSLGLPVVHERYPDGEEGIQKSIKTICTKVREGMVTAVMKEFAGNVLKQTPGALHGGTRERADALCNFVATTTGYAPDALGSEQIQSAQITLCVPGAQLCIPIRDCDDGVVAVGTLIGAAGMDVEVVRQIFGGGHQQHVLLEVKLEDGSWYPLDPSNKTHPCGVKAPAQRETRHSPFDSKLTGLSDQAQFVGMGALPVLVWQEPHSGFPGRWARLPSDAKLEGLGGILPSISDLQPQLKWLGTIWSTIDPKGRSWDTALADAYNRAEQKNWVAGDSTSYFDLTAIIVRSAILSRVAGGMPSPGPDAAAALDNSWKLIATKLGYTSQTSMDDLKTAAKRNNQVAALALFELIAVIIAIAALAVVYCFAIYYAAKIVDSLLTRLVAFAEEVWRNVQIQKMIDRHVNNPDLPWDPEEKKLLDQLEKQQDETHKAVIKPPDLSPPGAPPSFWDSPWAIFGIVTVVAGTAAAVVYRKEIKGALDRHGSRSGRSTAIVAT
jgi:hypothetical protein